MKMQKSLSGFWITLGLLLCAVGVLLGFCHTNAAPVLMKAPEHAAACAEMVMDAVCAGDYALVEASLQGRPSLGMERQPQTEAGQILRQAYQQSISYELSQGCWATDRGVAMDVTVRSMDMAAACELWNASGPDAFSADAVPRTAQTITLNLVYEQGSWWILPEQPLLHVISGIPE